MHNSTLARVLFVLLALQISFGSEDARPLKVKLTPRSSNQVSLEISPQAESPPKGVRFQTFAQPRDPNRVYVPVISPPCYTEIFELTHYDARCVSMMGVLFKGQGFPECKTKCLRQDVCGFIVLYSNGRCEGFADCSFMTPYDEKKRTLNGVRVFSRLSECQLEIFFGNGRYVKEIAKYFHGVAVLAPPNRNIHCICMNGRLANCVIFVKPGSEEEKVVQRILDKKNLQPPFYLTDAITPEQAPIVFSMERKNTKIDVIAEIRYMSPAFCIHISICYDGTPNKLCPITSKYFRAGEPVWILNSDVSAVRRRSAVPCLSDQGVRQISLAPSPGKDNLQYTSFFDPLGRQPSQKLLPNRDYTLFFVFDDRFLQTGICRDAPEIGEDLPTSPSEITSEGIKRKKSRGGGKKKKKSGAIDSSDLASESGASMSSSGTLQFDSPTPDLSGLSLHDQASDRPSSSEQLSEEGPSSQVPDLSQQKLEGNNLETKVAFTRKNLTRTSIVFIVFYIFFMFIITIFTSLHQNSGNFSSSLLEEDV